MTEERVDLDELMEDLADGELDGLEDELSEEELDALETEELEENEDSEPSAGYADELVTFGDRVFEIVEPNAGITLRIIKIVGALALRGEKNALRTLATAAKGGATNRAVLFGILAGLSERDLIALGSAVLQFEDDKEGRRWIAGQGLKLAPIIKALFLNVNKSDDLREALSNFFVGMEMTGDFLSGMIG